MHTSLMSSLLEAAQPVVTGAMNAPRSFLGVRDGIFQQREHPGKSPKVGMNWHFESSKEAIVAHRSDRGREGGAVGEAQRCQSHGVFSLGNP